MKILRFVAPCRHGINSRAWNQQDTAQQSRSQQIFRLWNQVKSQFALEFALERITNTATCFEEINHGD
jgi:hypothetical protein